MSEFQFVAYDEMGRRRTGVMEATDETSVTAHLFSNGMLPASVEPAKADLWKIDFQPGKHYKKVKPTELSFLFRQLGSVIRTGLPISSALAMQKESSPNIRLKYVLEDVENRLRSGQPLWQALSSNPSVFSPIYTDMLRAAEGSGNTAHALERAAAFAERDGNTKKKLKGALAYPAFVAIFAVLAVTVLIIYVMPRMKGTMEAFGVDMPLPTKIVMGISDFIINNGLLSAICAGLLVAAPFILDRTKKGKLLMDRVRLKVPLLGRVNQASAVSSFTRVLSEVMSVGMPMTEALGALNSSLGNAFLSGKFEEVAPLILAGEGVSRPLARAGILPVEAIQMIRIGEETGNLTDVAMELARFYEGEADHAITTMVDMVQPVMMAVIGGIVLLVGLSIIMPMYTSFGKMG